MFLFKKYFVSIAHNDSKESSNVFPAQYLPVIKSLSYNTSNLPIVRQVLRQKLERTTRQLHGAIYRPDSFVLMLRYRANLKAIRYECCNTTSLNRIVADKSYRVIVA